MRHRRAAAEGVVGEGSGEASVVCNRSQAIQCNVRVGGEAGWIDHGGTVAIEVVGVDGVEVRRRR